MYFNRKNKKKILYSTILLLLITLNVLFQYPLLRNQLLDSLNDEGQFSKDNKPKSSEIDYYSKEWIKYGNFSAGYESYWDSVTSGDTSDFNLAVSGDAATYRVMGEQREFSLDEDPIVGSNWSPVPNPEIPGLMDSNYTDSEGLHAGYTYLDQYSANQNPSIHWDNNCSMPVNMNDYEITSASLQSVVNATVDSDVDVSGDTIANDDNGAPLNRYDSYDIARFYVLLSDLSKNKVYEIAYYQNSSLGAGNPPGTYYMSDKNLISVSEDVLIFYLTSVLGSDNFNFTVTLGIRIYAADNSNTYDIDDFTDLLFKSINLTFTYEKKINQLDTASWKQEGKQESDKIPSDYLIENATLNFRYKTNLDWISNTGSVNSEFRIIINNNQLGETVKLSSATTSYQDFKTGGLDVSNFVDANEYVNTSIQIYIADEFILNSDITISIDNVTLVIWYGIYTEPDDTDYNLILDDVDRTIEKSGQVIFNENLNVTMIYKDSLGDFIPDANVQLTGGGLDPITLNPSAFENYYTIINSSDLGVGMTYLTLTASKRYYTTEQFQVTIEVVSRNTEIQLYLDNDNQTVDKEWTTDWNENLNITIQYRDIDYSPSTHISNALVELTGVGSTKTLSEDTANEQYEISINTFDLGLGSTFLTVYCSKENYTSLNIRFKITVTSRATYLDNIELGGAERYSIAIEWNEIFEIKLAYNDTLTDGAITGATVQVIGTGYQKDFNPDGDLYSLSVNTFDLSVGNNFLTLLAQKDNYTIASRLITVTVNERATTLDTILNHTSGTTITYPYGDLLNITAIYNDHSGPFIDGAEVELREGSTKIDDLIKAGVLDQYSVIINTNILGVGVNILTIYAKQDNYSAQFKSITIIVNERDTQLDIYLDDTPTTVIEIAYGEMLNVTASYIDFATSLFISGATVDVNGSGVSEVLIESYNNYTVMLDTTDLNFGPNFLAIYAFKENYSAILVSITIIVNERDTQLDIYLDDTPTTVIEISYGGSLNITVSYIDFATSLFISGATVDINGSGVSEILIESYNNYTLILDTSELSFGANFLTIYARKEGYEPQSITVVIQIIPIETLLTLYLNGEDVTLDPSITTYPNQLVNLTVSYIDFATTLFISGATVDVNGSGVSEILMESYSNYTVMLDTNELNFGANFLTIYARKDGYGPQSIIFTIQIIQIETELKLYLDGEDKTLSPAITSYPNQLLNLTVSYVEFTTTLFISGAIVDVNGSDVSEVLIESYSNYTVMLDTNKLNFGANFLTIYARKDGYEPQSIIFTIQIIQIETELKLYLDGEDKTLNPAITTYANQLINLTVSYKEYISTQFISGAIVDVNGSGVSEILIESYSNYTVMLDTSELNFGANFLTFYARKGGFEPQSITLTIQIIQIETVLKLYLNGNDKTLNPAITTYTNQLINLTVSYEEYISSQFISGAIIDVNGSGVSKVLVESYSNYTVMLDTTDLNFGANFLTIYARKGGYEALSIIFTIQLVLIETELTLYLNGDDKTLNPSITTYTNQVINLTVSYTESISMLFISGAILDVNGSGISEVLVESYSNYTVMLDTTDLNFGANFLTIYARKGGYEAQSIIFTIQLVLIETELTLYLNGEDKTLNPAITTYTNQLINLTVSYTESISMLFISGATLDVNGTGISEVLVESYNNYTVMLNTTELGFGANFLTIYARKDGYDPQTIKFTIQIIQIETELDLYLNDDANPIDNAIKVIVGESVNVTVIYKEHSGIFIDYADIIIVGEGIEQLNLTKHPTYDQYNVSVNTLDLNFGINLLTLYAQKANYQPQTIIIRIQISEKETDMEIYLNEQPKTIDKSISLPIRAPLNITVKYLDNDTRTHIPGSVIQLVGEGLTDTYLTENSLLGQYSISIDTTLLDIGVRFLTIYATHANYESYSALLRIQVNRIRTNITTTTGEIAFNREPGQSYHLQINLLDLDSETSILDANVTYTWTYGQGELTDSNNDGIYEGTISDLREGTFVITITAYAGDDYEFERYRITLYVVRPPEDVLLFQVLTILGIGAAVGIGGYLLAYQKVLKYPKQVRKIHKFKNKLKKAKSLGIDVQSREQIIKEHYSNDIAALEKQIKKKLSPKSDKVQMDSGIIDKTDDTKVNSP